MWVFRIETTHTHTHRQIQTRLVVFFRYGLHAGHPVLDDALHGLHLPPPGRDLRLLAVVLLPVERIAPQATIARGKHGGGHQSRETTGGLRRFRMVFFFGPHVRQDFLNKIEIQIRN